MTWTIFLGGNVDLVSLVSNVRGSNILEVNTAEVSELVLGGRVGQWVFYASQGFSYMPPEAWDWAYTSKSDYRFMMGRRVKRFNVLAGTVFSHPIQVSMDHPRLLWSSFGVQAEVSLPLFKDFSVFGVKVSPTLSPRVGAVYYPMLRWWKGGNRVDRWNVLRLYARTIVALGVGR